MSPKVSWPACGRMKPQTAFSSVVLPAPFGPMIPVTWRGVAVSETASSAVTPPKRTVTSRTCSAPPCSGGGISGELRFIGSVPVQAARMAVV